MNVFERLKIKLPIIEGGMTLVGDGHLAATVSNSGALGVIGTGKFNYIEAKKQVEIALKETKKPFGLNIMLENKNVIDLLQLVKNYRIPFVTLGGGDPTEYIGKLKELGTIVYPVVPSVAAAKRMERLGADGIIAEGMESGGHIGSITTMALVPQVVKNINIPVIAAGGIATGAAILGSFALGAVGVQIGTAFAITKESPASKNYKNLVLKARDIDTVITGATVGEPVRGIKNQYTRNFKKAEEEWQKKADNSSVRDVTILAKGSLYNAIVNGDVQNGSAMAGQISGLLDKSESVKSLLNRLINEFNEAKLKVNFDLEGMAK
ncbi:hypothetical protein BTW26_05450 [Pediococcus acidilactici]|jgi:enoyl-[acyl-carrier protein] reductase II|uniref:DUF561 domain-containing protein n=1 Tax=Pediococcus acidilactici TaxID=1254 RepID=UPI0009473225|nr:DUF561 domain-containing protein [Pediococcus acidilactici]APR28487.1 hypothetical protein BTW26_05450 [Pediococcus acidilactici]